MKAPTSRLIQFLYVGATLWFIFKAGFFALHVSPGAPPDEMYHLQVIDIYAKSAELFPFYGSTNPLLTPRDEFVRFGDTTELTHLYHLLMGWLVDLVGADAFDFRTIVALRLINLALTLGSLYCFYCLSCLYLSDSRARILAYVLHTNVLMFTLLAGSVGHDPASNLAAYAALLVLAKFERSPSLHGLLWLTVLLSLGSLVKLIIVPFAVVISVSLLAILLLRRRSTDCREPSILTFNGALRHWPLTLAAVGTSVCLAAILGVQLAKYGSFIPTCAQIFSATECAQFNRESVFDPVEYPPQHEEVLSFPVYSVFWLKHVVASALGIRSHVGVDPPLALVLLVECLLIGSIFHALFASRKDRSSWIVLCAVIISFSVFVCLYQGYGAYKLSRNYGYMMNGRYLFPILGAGIIVLVSFIMLILSTLRRSSHWWLVAALAATIEFPVFYLSAAGQTFLRPWPPELYEHLLYYPNPVYDQSFSRIVPVTRAVTGEQVHRGADEDLVHDD